jgi:hypothetical protein
VAAISYESALAMAESLSHEEQLRLIQELMDRAGEGAFPEPEHSNMELCGFGKEIWQGMDAQEYVDRERASWNG